jgi:hypothetical protein
MVNLGNAASIQKPRLPRETVLTVLMTPVVIFFGLVLSLGDKLLDIALFGIVGGCFLLFLPLPLVMLALVVTTLLIAGTAEYFVGVTQAQWIPFLMALALYARVPLEMLRHGRTRPKCVERHSTPALYWLIGCYLSLIIFTALVNQAPIVQTLVGSKSYIFFWSFLFLILVADITPQNLNSFWKWIVAVAVLQLPFALYQHFVIMKMRVSMWAADAVAGTFGGDPNRGGANATLLLYMLVAALYATALYREGLLKRGWWLASLLLSAVVIALGETKIAVVLVPLSFFIIYWDHLKKNIGSLLGFAAIMVLAIGALVAFYQFAYWSDSLRSRSLTESAEKSVKYMVDPNNMTRENGEVGRVAALNLWWEDPQADVVRRAIGYGPGASRGVSTVSIGEVAKRYLPYTINTSAAATLLWDVGVIGLACLLAILISGALLAYRVAGKVASNSPQRAGLRTATASLVCMLIMVPYNRSVVDEAAVQLLMLFCLGYAAYWYRATDRASNAR